MRETHTTVSVRPFPALAAALVVSAAGAAHGHDEVTVARSAMGQLVGHNHAHDTIALEASIFEGIDGFATGLIGFHSADVDEPLEDMYALADTCSIEAVLVSIDHGLVVHDGFQQLAVGDTMFFGSPFFDYHPIFQLEEHHHDDVVSLQFIFRDRIGVYTPSEPMTMTFAASAEHGCPADFNEDGGIDGADVDAFFAEWEMGGHHADVNADGGIDGSDVGEFFMIWENGGC